MVDRCLVRRSLRLRRAVGMLAWMGVLYGSLAHARLSEMPEESMGEVYGQAMLQITNTTFTAPPTAYGNLADSSGGANGLKIDGWPVDDNGNTISGPLTYSRLSIGADISMDVDIKRLRLGVYNRGYADGNDRGGADVNIDNWILTGWHDNGGKYHPFRVKNPYVEIAMKDADKPGAREVLGFRFGFEEMQGIMGLNINRLSGRTYLETTPINIWPLNGIKVTINTYDIRSQGDASIMHLLGLNIPLLTESYLHSDAVCVGLPIAKGRCGPSDGPMTDFWMSFNKVGPLFYPKINNVNDYYPAQKGVWLNMADNAKVMTLLNLPGILGLLNSSPANLRRAGSNW